MANEKYRPITSSSQKYISGEKSPNIKKVGRQSTKLLERSDIPDFPLMHIIPLILKKDLSPTQNYLLSQMLVKGIGGNNLIVNLLIDIISRSKEEPDVPSVDEVARNPDLMNRFLEKKVLEAQILSKQLSTGPIEDAEESVIEHVRLTALSLMNDHRKSVLSTRDRTTKGESETYSGYNSRSQMAMANLKSIALLIEELNAIKKRLEEYLEEGDALRRSVWSNSGSRDPDDLEDVLHEFWRYPLEFLEDSFVDEVYRSPDSGLAKARADFNQNNIKNCWSNLLTIAGKKLSEERSRSILGIDQCLAHIYSLYPVFHNLDTEDVREQTEDELYFTVHKAFGELVIKIDDVIRRIAKDKIHPFDLPRAVEKSYQTLPETMRAILDESMRKRDVKNFWINFGWDLLSMAAVLVPIIGPTLALGIEAVQLGVQLDDMIDRLIVGSITSKAMENPLGVEKPSAFEWLSAGVSAILVSADVPSVSRSIQSIPEKFRRGKIVSDTKAETSPLVKTAISEKPVMEAPTPHTTVWKVEEMKRLSNPMMIEGFDLGEGIARRTGNKPTYLVRIGKAGRGKGASIWGDHLFDTLEDAEKYAKWVYETQSEIVGRETRAIPSGSWPGGGVSKFEAIKIFEVPPNTAYWQGVVAKQFETATVPVKIRSGMSSEELLKAGEKAMTLPGGGPQVLVDPAKLTELKQKGIELPFPKGRGVSKKVQLKKTISHKKPPITSLKKPYILPSMKETPIKIEYLKFPQNHPSAIKVEKISKQLNKYANESYQALISRTAKSDSAKKAYKLIDAGLDASGAEFGKALEREIQIRINKSSDRELHKLVYQKMAKDKVRGLVHGQAGMPDWRYPLGKGEEAIFDATTIKSKGKALSKYGVSRHNKFIIEILYPNPPHVKTKVST